MLPERSAQARSAIRVMGPGDRAGTRSRRGAVRYLQTCLGVRFKGRIDKGARASLYSLKYARPTRPILRTGFLWFCLSELSLGLPR